MKDIKTKYWLKKLVLLVQFLHCIWEIVSPLDIYQPKILNFVNRMAMKHHPALFPTKLISLNLSKALWLDYQFLHICGSKKLYCVIKTKRFIELNLPKCHPHLWHRKKIVYFTCAHIIMGQKYLTNHLKTWNHIVIEKTRVGCTIVAFHMRNCHQKFKKLNILNPVYRVVMKHHPAHVPTRLSSLNLEKALWLDFQFLHVRWS